MKNFDLKSVVRKKLSNCWAVFLFLFVLSCMNWNLKQENNMLRAANLRLLQSYPETINVDALEPVQWALQEALTEIHAVTPNSRYAIKTNLHTALYILKREKTRAEWLYALQADKNDLPAKPVLITLE